MKFNPDPFPPHVNSESKNLPAYNSQTDELDALLVVEGEDGGSKCATTNENDILVMKLWGMTKEVIQYFHFLKF